MKYLLLVACAALISCGGGGQDAQPLPAPISIPDDLATASIASTTSSTTCDYPAGSQKITGTVTSVHDGDTLTLDGGTKVRLDTIDAPELAQDYGQQSQKYLSNLVLGSTVTVAYSKTDRYGRTVGAVFDASCLYVNLKMVATGNAWFYRAYQCEVDQSVRAQFSSAESAAFGAHIGLWSGEGWEPPWKFRNGTEPKVPACPTPSASISPATPTVTPTAPTDPTPSTPPSTSTPTTGCKMVWVNGYTRSNGTHVNGYYRRSPGCA